MMTSGNKDAALASYRRVSRADGDLGKDGKDESNSVENQKALIDEYIESRDEFFGMEVMEFVDDGYTGLNFERPAFQRMMEQVKSGRVKTILVKDLSRFGRDYIGVGEYLEQIFPVLGVRLIAINSNYDSNDYIGTTMGLDVAVSNLVNTMYSRDVGKKLRSANEVKWKNGYSTNGSAPFGYVFDPEKKGRYKIDPQAAQIVRRIFDYALVGLSTSQIAYQLNEEKIPITSEYNRIHQVKGKANQYVLTPDKIWNAEKVWRILREYAYTGAMVLGKRRVILSGTNVVRQMPREKQYITEGAHEAIVTHEEFEEAQAVIRFTSKREYLTKNDYALRKKIRCGHCKRVMSQNFKLNDPIVWCDDGRGMAKHSNCPGEKYSISQIENIAFHALRHMLFILRVLNKEIAQKDREKAAWEKQLIKRQQQTEEKIGQLQIERVHLYEAYGAKVITLKEYQLQRDEIGSRIADLQRQIEREAADSPKEPATDSVRRLAKEADGFLADDKLTKNAATAFIENVYIYEGARVEVRFRFEDEIGQALERLGIAPGELMGDRKRKGDGEHGNSKDDWKIGFTGTVPSAYVRPAGD